MNKYSSYYVYIYIGIGYRLKKLKTKNLKQIRVGREQIMKKNCLVKLKWIN